MTETIWPAKLKLFNLWSYTEKNLPNPQFRRLIQQNLEMGIMDRKGQRSHLDKIETCHTGKVCKMGPAEKNRFCWGGGQIWLKQPTMPQATVSRKLSQAKLYTENSSDLYSKGAWFLPLALCNLSPWISVPPSADWGCKSTGKEHECLVYMVQSHVLLLF